MASTLGYRLSNHRRLRRKYVVRLNVVHVDVQMWQTQMELSL